MSAMRFGRDDLVKFGRAVREARLQRGLSQQEVSAAAGISPRTLGQIEGGSTSPSLLTGIRVAEALGVSLEKLVAAARQTPVVAVTTRAGTAGGGRRDVDLTGDLESPRMRARILEVPPGSLPADGVDARPRFGFVLDGRVTVITEEGSETHLDRHDSIHALATVVRALKGADGAAARLLHIEGPIPEEQ